MKPSSFWFWMTFSMLFLSFIDNVPDGWIRTLFLIISGSCFGLAVVETPISDKWLERRGGLRGFLSLLPRRKKKPPLSMCTCVAVSPESRCDNYRRCIHRGLR